MTVVVGGIVPNEAAVMLLDLVSSTTFSNGIVGDCGIAGTASPAATSRTRLTVGLADHRPAPSGAP